MKERVLVGAVFWVFICGLVLLYGWPFPQSWKQWALLIAIGPPTYVLAEAAGESLFSRRLGEAISQRRFSMARVIFALLALFIVLVVAWAVVQLLEGVR